MPTVQERVTDAVLATIRSRRDNRNTISPATNPSASRSRSVSVRVAEFSDFDRVAQLNNRLGQGTDSEANWRRLWSSNPAVESGRASGRVGWVLESGGDVVGFFGTIPLLYEFEGTILVAAASCRFAVEPEFRTSSHLLVFSFLRQTDVDLFLNTSATPAAGKMMQALKAAPVPQKDYGTVLFWVLNPRRFVEAVLRKLETRPGLVATAGLAGSLALSGEARLRRRFPRVVSAGLDVSECDPGELSSEFDEFCERETLSRTRLLGKRNSAIVRWHFTAPESKRVSRVLLCRQEGRIVGYAVVRQELDAKVNLRRSSVADLLAANDDAKIVKALVAAAHFSARQSGSDVLEVTGFPAAVRRPLLEWKPYVRQYPSCPYFYKARDRALHERLSNVDCWYACPFDGDATLWP